MIFVLNSMAFMWMAGIWSKSGLPNILIAMVFTALAVANAIAASPHVLAWISPQ